MLYLAEIQRYQFKRNLELRLLAIQRGETLWSVLNPTEILTLPASLTDLGDSVLVLAELNNQRQVIQFKPAHLHLPQILQNLSQSILLEKSQQKEIDLWRESLEFQAAELQRRSETIDELELQLKSRELKLMDAIAQLNLTKVQLNREKEAYATAWGHLRDKEQAAA